MKICILTHTFPRFKKDVAAPFMDGVAEGIRKAGNEVFVLAPYSPKYKRSKKDQKYKIVLYKYIWPDFLHKLGYSETLSNDTEIKPLVWVLSPFMHLFAIIALYKLVKKEKIDLINAHWILPNGFIACVVSVLTGVPVVSTLPGSDVYLAQKNIFFSLMARFATRVSRSVTSNSPQLLKDLAKISEEDRKNIKVIQKKFLPIIYGVDTKKFSPSNSKNNMLRKKLNIEPKEIIVLGVGRLVAKKGFTYLIKAAPQILKKHKNIKFVLIGEGDQRKELESLVEKENVADRFIFLKWVDYSSIVDYFNFADIFILPSVRDEEGNLDDQSVSVVEAMSCGKPIITTNFPGYKIVVKDDLNGYLVPEKDSQEITIAINKLVISPAKRKSMGKMSRKLIVDNFSWDSIGKTYTNLFKALV